MWIGTHSLPTAPANYVPNDTFHGSTSITITSTGVTFGNNTVTFNEYDDISNCVSLLTAGRSDETLNSSFRLDYTSYNHESHSIYKNLHKGESAPACGTRWFDARVYAKIDGIADTALINHSACD